MTTPSRLKAARGPVKVRLPELPGQWVPALLIGLLALVPVFTRDEYTLGVWTFILLNLLVVLGLDLLLGYAGQLSLGHGAFVAIGAYTSALLTTQAGWSGWAAMPAGVFVSALVAAIVAVPTLRLRGYYLAMATLGFPIMLDALVRASSSWSGGASGLTAIPRLQLGDLVLRDAVHYYLLVLAFVALALCACWAIAQSRMGLRLRAIHADETAAAARGVPVVRLKVAVFVFSAALAALSGSLYVHQVQFVAAGTFGVQYSLMLVVMLVAGGTGRVWGGVVGVVALGWLPELLRGAAAWQPVIFGSLLAVLMLFSPHGIAGLLRRRPSFRPDEADSGGVVVGDWLPPPTDAQPVPLGQEMLRAQGLCKRFGGVTAVSGLDVSMRSGQIVALIGPNGAGKSTALALISGAIPADAGQVTLVGRDCTVLGADARARAGLGRTFQHARLIPSLSVFENIVIGASVRAGSVDDTLAAARAVLDKLGLAEVAQRFPDQINHYERRITEVAVALAADPAVLLLDEPAAGLSTAEVQNLAQLLRQLREQGKAILLVDHIMALVLPLSDHVVVLDGGQPIAQGKPQDVVNDARVRAAYLGRASAHA